MGKLYVVVRADLPAGSQLAQACHGLRAFVAAHPEIDRAWYEQSNNLVCLAVPSEAHLLELAAKARARDVAIAEFREPDEGDSVTAIALEPAGARLVSSLPLALRAA